HDGAQRAVCTCAALFRSGFAGIAKPWKVERSLIAAGCDLKDFAPFPDHAALSERDFAFLKDRAAVYEAGLVTTEKDWVRLTPDQDRKSTRLNSSHVKNSY